MNMRQLSRAARLILGIVFLLSSIPKLREPQAFLDNVYGYQLVQPKMGILIASVLPWLELIIAINLLVGVFVGGSLVVAVVLGAIFTFANASAIIHGLSISCGCFGNSGSSSPINWTTLVISAGIGLIAFLGLIWQVTARTNPPSIQSSV
ncbi:MAG TPA: MauE/DoxX family redox-associated membrane protein [Tepidisphaeraceae bacterium]